MHYITNALQLLSIMLIAKEYSRAQPPEEMDLSYPVYCEMIRESALNGSCSVQ